MRAALVVLLWLAAGAACAQTPLPAPTSGVDDCGCAGDAECLLFCGKRSVATPGSIGSRIGNKGLGMQKRIEDLDSLKPKQ
jgi:hypothetical protein